VSAAVGLFLQVLPLAIGAAMSPTFLAMQVLVLTSGAPGVLRRGWSLAAGSMTMLLLISFGGLSLLSALPDFQTGQPSYEQAAILIVAGLALLAVAAVIRRRPSHPDAALERVVDAGPPVLFAVGALRLAINATTLALYIPALHMITQSSVDIAAKAVVFAMLFAITEIAVVGPVLAVTIMGDRAKPVLTRIHLAIEQRSRTLTLVTCAGFGAVLIAVGIRVLTQVG
jgi:hypothetical protein